MEEAALKPNWFSKPGDSLISAMRRRGLTASELANQLAGGIEQLRSFVNGSASIDARSAAVLASAVGGSKEFWLKRQENYERDLERATTAIPDDEADVWLSDIPVPGAKPRGRLNAEIKRAELQRRLAFFGVSTLDAWEIRYGAERNATRFRTSNAFSSADGAVSLWLRQGEFEAVLADTAPWNPECLRDQLHEIVGLSRIAKPERFLPQLKRLLAKAGVALAVVQAPKNCRASGASKLIRSDKAMILLSFRHRSDDQFWFTVFHEIGHLVLHGGQTFVDGDDIPDTQAEQEANHFAASAIIPPKLWARFADLEPSHQDITRFAVSAGVSAGLILGQLQNAGRVPHEKMSFLRRRWTWPEIETAISSL